MRLLWQCILLEYMFEDTLEKHSGERSNVNMNSKWLCIHSGKKSEDIVSGLGVESAAALWLCLRPHGRHHQQEERAVLQLPTQVQADTLPKWMNVFLVYLFSLPIFSFWYDNAVNATSGQFCPQMFCFAWWERKLETDSGNKHCLEAFALNSDSCLWCWQLHNCEETHDQDYCYYNARHLNIKILYF